MTNKGLSKLGLQLLDRVTDTYPSFGPKVFQRAFVGFFGSRIVSDFFLRKYRKRWDVSRSALRKPEHGSQPPKILLVVDVCIGDAVLASEGLRTISQSFPYAELHYVCNKTGGELIEGMPGVHVHNIIHGARGFPTEDDYARLLALVAREKYSVVLNLGPFLSKKTLGSKTNMIQLYVPFAAFVFRAWKLNKTRHISYLSRAFAAEFLATDGYRLNQEHQVAAYSGKLNTNSVYLSRDSIARAHAFLDDCGVRIGSGIVFFNPDATSQFGQIPFAIQTTLLRQIAELNSVSAILIGRAYTSVDIERSLIASLPEVLREKVHIVPHMPIEAYTALIDASDMFISGDTGPLHIAACRKLGEDGRPLRNKTVVLAIYGATDSRMYGYDSEQPFHAPANQDVPSRSFSAPVPCRNITCVNKFGKSCSEVRCFDHLPVDEIFEYITSYFQTLSGERISFKSNLEKSNYANVQKPITITLTPEREYAI
jgi:ADP-heptose:LPS heptosyltransferase